MNKFIRVVAAGVAGHIVGSVVGGVSAIGTDAAASLITEDETKRNKAAMVVGTIGYWVAGVNTAIKTYKSFE